MTTQDWSKASSDVLTVELLQATAALLENEPMPLDVFEVGSRSLQWLKDHQVDAKDATHFVYGVPVRVEVDD